MYPFKDDDCDYARGQWYVAAWSDEVSRTPLERWILGEPVVLYRTETGLPVALDGRCPHRNFPMSKGVLRGDDLECGYHGITFAPDGTCVRIPSQAAIPSGCKLRAYPLIEKWKLLWIWTGEPDKADPALIPDHEEIRLEKEGWLATQGFTVMLNSRYQLLNENLMDISHLSYLHAGTIGTQAVAGTDVQIIDGPRFLRGTRRISNDSITGFFAEVLGYNGNIDREVLIDYYAPGLHVAWEIFMKPGTIGTLDTLGTDGNPNVLGMYRVHHMVTPATRDKTNYFIAYSRTFARDDTSVTDTMTSVFTSVIMQDVEASEAIEQLLAKREAAPTELLLRADGHSVRGRRKLEALMQQERAQA
ncbi:aromatic ring-hydroxylating dioxygenase subunit alpha [Paraburkholderia sp. ZP32-5]|uniref:aromatic ring-hydroxylating dioxygenase subunit alpha n=1 Tax=Paraburkholderia sp. ZP32-5 TaxID=2883245 RepID=UPI001F3DFA43|nr:aromatic ring-hydroxylating dioxygenase subunit alpha [Paraburkholderia sp. ZP32-5]